MRNSFRENLQIITPLEDLEYNVTHTITGFSGSCKFLPRPV